MRAIEQGLPLARVANTGISAMIDPLGRVLARLPLGAEGFVDAALPAPLPITAYSRFGDLPWVSAVLIIFVLTVVYFRSGISSRERPDKSRVGVGSSGGRRQGLGV